jgi:uncharacterized protein
MNSQTRRWPPVAMSTHRALQLLSPVALALIGGYRFVLSPILFSMWGPACRFEPTCSAYAAEAIRHYGIMRGAGMSLTRLMKCRPLGGSGFDPVPVADCTKTG